ncbi:hypothetical protein JCGZ_00843 [Jatropha curcas]|uniref:Uncharacterized protein n=1 Tax=Jatropha curcas TaxID=180498 RepID=A0A067KS89_JATCU|nr:pre-rRNA-processing protein ESF1 [Jatropha curcas]KDP39086.1 hypothetical protein JCGZ_00843 [Jatropha curcas]
MGSKNADYHNKKRKNKPNRDLDAEENHHEGGGAGSGGGGRKVIADPRFVSVHYDPRFQKVSMLKSKVAIDSRFSRMFTDKNFQSSAAPLDKRGKVKKNKTENALRHYYRIEEEERKEVDKDKKHVSYEEDDSEEEVEDESESEELGKLGRAAAAAAEEEEEEEADEKELSSQSEASESEDDEESTTDEEDEEMFYEEDVPEVEVENIPTIEDGTRRLAVVNMDWRHVRAGDLYVVLSSFLPKRGAIKSVAVYPSEFGLERMKEEELHGPVGLFDNENEKKDDDSGDDEIDEEKLRAYEKSRLRYFYAVVECDSIATAEHLYKACDGVEFERSSNVLDLRFVPDSMEFKHPPRDIAEEAPTNYDGLDFHTKALQHSNIAISWDEDEPQRVKTLKRKFNADQLADLELKEFLASDESESDEDENDDVAEGEVDKKIKKRDKYRALIEAGDGSDGENEEEGQDMEITFHTGLEGLSKRLLERKDKKSESVWEATLREKREKKAARRKRSKHSSEEDSSDSDDEMREEADDFFVEEPSIKKGKKDAQVKSKKEVKQLQDTDKEAEASRAELELLLADENGADTGPKGYNMKRKKAKGKRKKEVPDENKIPTVDYDDRFSALFTSPLYALDPTDPQFKRSAAYARQMAQKQRKGDLRELGGEHEKQATKSEAQSDEPDKKKTENADVLPSNKEKLEISSLVKSLKMKSKQLSVPSNSKKKKNGKLQTRDAKEMGNHELSALVQSVKKKAKVMQK